MLFYEEIEFATNDPSEKFQLTIYRYDAENNPQTSYLYWRLSASCTVLSLSSLPLDIDVKLLAEVISAISAENVTAQQLREFFKTDPRKVQDTDLNLIGVSGKYRGSEHCGKPFSPQRCENNFYRLYIEAEKGKAELYFSGRYRDDLSIEDCFAELSAIAKKWTLPSRPRYTSYAGSAAYQFPSTKLSYSYCEAGDVVMNFCLYDGDENNRCAYEDATKLIRFNNYSIYIDSPVTAQTELNSAADLSLYRDLLKANGQAGLSVLIDDLPRQYNDPVSNYFGEICSFSEENCRYFQNYDGDKGVISFGIENKAGNENYDYYLNVKNLFIWWEDIREK